MALLKCTYGSVLAFLNSTDGSVLALLKSTDGSILALLRLPSIFSCQNSTVGEFWCTMAIMPEKQQHFLFEIECKIIITQEKISGREIVEVEFIGEKIKKKKNIWEADTGIMNLRREIWERTFGNEIQVRENMELKSWGDIEEK